MPWEVRSRAAEKRSIWGIPAGTSPTRYISKHLSEQGLSGHGLVSKILPNRNEAQGEKIFVEFQGVDIAAAVQINGNSSGKCRGKAAPGSDSRRLLPSLSARQK